MIKPRAINVASGLAQPHDLTAKWSCQVATADTAEDDDDYNGDDDTAVWSEMKSWRLQHDSALILVIRAKTVS